MMCAYFHVKLTGFDAGWAARILNSDDGAHRDRPVACFSGNDSMADCRCCRLVVVIRHAVATVLLQLTICRKLRDELGRRH